MNCYRLYLVTDTGHIAQREELVADDDAEAIRFVERIPAAPTCELWCGSRLVQGFGTDTTPIGRTPLPGTMTLFARPLSLYRR